MSEASSRGTTPLGGRGRWRHAYRAKRHSVLGRLTAMSPLEGDYEPSPYGWVREQVAEYEASGGRRAKTLGDTGLPVVLGSTRGKKARTVRNTPVTGAEHAGGDALVAAQGGLARPPGWCPNTQARPEAG